MVEISPGRTPGLSAPRTRSRPVIMTDGGIAMTQSLPATPEISTEAAITAFGFMLGVANFAGQLVAANRLASRDADTVPTASLLVPAGIALGGVIAAAILIPSEG